MTGWRAQKQDLFRASVADREARLLAAFRRLERDGQVVVTGYCEAVLDAEQQRADRERAR